MSVEEARMNPTLIAWVLGSTMVFAHSLLRFNTPDTTRGGTPLWRYSTFIIIYVATMEMLWLVFALAPGLPGMPGTVSDNLKRLQPALASALALTLFLSDMPWIRPLEARWRG